MNVEFDEVKNAINIEKHGFPLTAFEMLDMSSAVFHQDKRKEYGEDRIKVYAFLNERLCTAVFTLRKDTFRIIRFRKANRKERKKYEKEI
jgi:hypothetical protein